MTGLRALPMFGIATVLMVAAVSGQGGGAVQTRADPIAALLNEVRGLRVEMSQAAGASMRMQLLVARLGLQEGRINTISRQLADARQQLANAQLALIPLTEQALQAQASGQYGDILKPMLEQIQQQERALSDQESQLAGLLAAEQGRWTDFNAQIDALERTLPAITIPR